MNEAFAPKPALQATITQYADGQVECHVVGHGCQATPSRSANMLLTALSLLINQGVFPATPPFPPTPQREA